MKVSPLVYELTRRLESRADCRVDTEEQIKHGPFKSTLQETPSYSWSIADHQQCLPCDGRARREVRSQPQAVVKGLVAV